MESPTRMRKPYNFNVEDDGFASIPEISINSNTTNQHIFNLRRKNSLRNISSSPTAASSPRSRVPHSPAPHYLGSCALCSKHIAANRDIFMYRGDTPFCSEECRQDQIEIDEANEKNWSFKSMRANKESAKNLSSSSTSKPQTYSIRTSTVAAA